jgi:hypothetical protein
VRVAQGGKALRALDAFGRRQSPSDRPGRRWLVRHSASVLVRATVSTYQKDTRSQSRLWSNRNPAIPGTSSLEFRDR